MLSPSGAYDGSGTGDGDGVDIDVKGYVENWGVIEGTGAAGLKKDSTNPNQSEGVAISSNATIINHAGATIRAPAAAISTVGTASLVNDGTIIADNRAYGSYGSNTIVNTGTIKGVNNEGFISYFDGTDMVVNSGLISGGNGYAIRFGGGDDTLVVKDGAGFNGLVDGGRDTDTVDLADGIVFNTSSITGFEKLGAIEGTGTILGAGGFESTSISSGATLRVGNGQSNGPALGSIANAGTLVLDGTGDRTFSDGIAGSGTIRKEDPFALTVSGDASGFAGTTEIAAGRLTLDGALGGTLDIAAGAGLEGTGSLGNVMLGGVVSPGHSIGTLSVGDIAFEDGSTYAVELGDPDSDLIHASGTATIAPGAKVTIERYAIGDDFTILSADAGLAGTFETDDTSPFFSTTFDYDSKTVRVSVTKTHDFADAGQTPSEIATGRVIDNLGPSSRVAAAFSSVQTLAQARGVLDRLSGAVHPSMAAASIGESVTIRDAVLDRLATAGYEPVIRSAPDNAFGPGSAMKGSANASGYAFWGRAIGSWGSLDGGGASADLDHSLGGVLVGADTLLAESWRVGLMAGYSRSSFDSDALASSADSDNFHFGLYGGTHRGPFTFSAGASVTWHRFSTERSVAIGGANQHLTADYDGRTLQAFGEVGYRMHLGPVGVEPFVNAAYVDFRTDGFTETGGAAALTAASQDEATPFTSLGARIATVVPIGERMAVVRGLLGWRHAYGDLDVETAMRFAGGSAFDVQGTPIAGDAAVVEAGFDLPVGLRTTLSFDVSGQYGSDATNTSVGAKAVTRF